jgi:prophage DNA circulation protein
MSWRDNLRPASFRGVQFKTRATEISGGKRGQLHEYPQQDIPFFEELGRQGEAFGVDAYVINEAANGFDYMGDRDALLEVVRDKGPGLLVHPYRGEITVQCTNYNVRESTEDGGMAVFALTFVESGVNSFPSPAPRTGALVQTSAAAASTAASSTFAKIFSVLDTIQWIVDDAVQVIGVTSSFLAAAIAAIPVAGDDLATYIRDVRILATDAQALVADPNSLASNVLELVARLSGLPSPATFALLSSLEGLSRYGEDLLDIDETTPNRVRQAQNRRQNVHLVRRAAALEAARAAATIHVASYSDAIALRDRVVAIIDAQADAAGELGDDEAFRALRALAVAVIRDITARGATLSRLTSFTPPATLPVLVIANRIYGDLSHVDEILARNHIRHPGFVPGGRPLEILVAA